MSKVKHEHETEAEMAAMGFDEEEKDILRSYNREEWKSTPISDEKRTTINEAARTTLETVSKNHDVTVTISGSDLIGIQSKAFEQGISCKALIATVLHKYAKGELVERETGA